MRQHRYADLSLESTGCLDFLWDGSRTQPDRTRVGDAGDRTADRVCAGTLDQNEKRQLEGQVVDRVFTDKASGRDTARPTAPDAARWKTPEASPDTKASWTPSPTQPILTTPNTRNGSQRWQTPPNRSTQTFWTSPR
jgi:hypothetical protein